MKRYRQIVNSSIAPSVNDLWLYKGNLKYFGDSGWVSINGADNTSSDIPTKVSELENDANYVTATELESKGYQTEEDCAEAVATAVSNLVNSAPETLDTLQELAEALGNDPNFATTITALIGQKLDTVTYESDKETFALKTDIPTVPTNISAFTNDAGYLVSGDLADYAKTSEIPTKVSELTNDSGYITETELATELEDYAKTTDIPDTSGYVTSTELEDYALKTEIPTVPTTVSSFTNDAGYITESMTKLCDIRVDSFEFEGDIDVLNGVSNFNYSGDTDKLYYVDITDGSGTMRVSLVKMQSASYIQYYGIIPSVGSNTMVGLDVSDQSLTMAMIIATALPTKTSELTNDSNFIKSTSATNITVVTELPASPDDNTLYLIVSE